MRKLLLVLPFLLLVPLFSLYSQGFNALTFYPALEGDGINGLSAKVGQEWDFRVTTMILYEKSPLQIGKSRTDTEDVIPHLVVTYWGASLNFPYRFQGFLLLPWNTYAKIEDPVNEINQSVSTFGDISFGLKYTILDQHPLPGVAIAVDGVIPSGSPEYYLGTSSFLYKFIIIGDYLIKNHYLYLNLSYTVREAEEIANLDLDDQLGYIIGYSFPRGGKTTFTAEIQGSTVLRHPFQNESMNPVELNGKIRFSEKSVDWGIVAGTGLTKGIGAPDYRIGVFISYPPSKPAEISRRILPAKVDTSCLKYFLLPSSKRPSNSKCENAEFGYIIGKVETFSGFPVPDAFVTIQPGNLQIKVDKKSKFIVKLKPGIYYLKANKREFTSTEALIELKPREVKKVTLKMKYLEGTLIIRLYNYKLQQIGGTISIYSGSRLLKRYRISPRGAMIKLPPGEYVIEGGIEKFKTVSKIVEIKPGSTTEVDLIVR